MQCRPPAISLFSGALGLDLGLEAAGFEVRVAVECDPVAVETIRRNRPNVPVIQKRIEEVSTAEILAAARLERGEAALISGGPACQAFSTAGQRGSVADPRGRLFEEFLRIVVEAQPRFFLMENVKGLLSAAITHRPLALRGPGSPTLLPEEQLGSAFLLIAQEMRQSGYAVIFDVLNAADFGVAQTRERLIFIGSRDGEAVRMPGPTHDRLGVQYRKPWVTLREALSGLDDPEPLYTPFPDSRMRFVRLIPHGGNWRDLPQDSQREALGGAYASWGGRAGFYRRLSWDRPAPALTTHPSSKATMLCHPTLDRPLSVREYARIQQFPDDWVFAGSTAKQYLQIGNAVPIGLATAVGCSIRCTMDNRTQRVLQGISCPNSALLQRLRKRPLTILNPPRMRAVPGTARDWSGGPARRVAFSEFELQGALPIEVGVR